VSKLKLGISLLVLIIMLLSGVALYATNGLNNTMNKQLSILFKTPGRLTKTYDNLDSRYMINYPVDWDYDKSTAGTVIFSGREGVPSFVSSVNIQVVLTKSMKGEYSTVSDFMGDIKRQVKRQSSQADFIEEGPITIKQRDGELARGQYVIFTYQFNHQTIKQWQIVVLRHDGQVFYAWAYTSTASQYDMDLPIAKAMLDSWGIY